MSRLSLSHLRVFCEVAANCSVTQAAARLHRTQPAISRQLSELETIFGVTLFSRNGRQLSITQAGEELLVRSRALLVDAEALEERAHELSVGRGGLLRVGSMSLALESFFPRVLLAFRQAWPEIGIRLREADGPELEIMVATGQLDVAFTRDISSDALSSQRLFPMQLVAVLPPSHPFNSRDNLDIKDLEREPILVTPEGSGSRVLLARACQAEGIKLREIQMESRAFNGMVSLARADYGIVIAVSSVATNYPGLKIVPILHRGEPQVIWFSAIWHRSGRSDQADALVETAQRVLKDNYPGQHLNRTN